MSYSKKADSKKSAAIGSLAVSETPYFRIEEAAAYLRCSPWTIAQAIRDKSLPYIPLGKKYVVTRADLDKFAQAARVSA